VYVSLLSHCRKKLNTPLVSCKGEPMYFRTDEEAEAAEALCMASRLSDGLDRDVRLWRWVIIALHNAAQGFMVLSLRHGNGLAALTKESAAAWLKAHENGGDYPPERLDHFPNLYAKIKGEEHGQIAGNKRFTPGATHDSSFKKLNDFRNEFIHFTPKGWSLEVDGLPEICLDVISVIEFLSWQTENIMWHELPFREQSQLCSFKLKEQMLHLKRVYAVIGS